MLQFILLGVILAVYAVFFPYMMSNFIGLVFSALFFLFLFEKANEKWFWMYFLIYILVYLPIVFALFKEAVIPAFLIFWVVPVYILPKVKNPFFWNLFIFIAFGILTIYPGLISDLATGNLHLLHPILDSLGFNG